MTSDSNDNYDSSLTSWITASNAIAKRYPRLKKIELSKLKLDVQALILFQAMLSLTASMSIPPNPRSKINSMETYPCLPFRLPFLPFQL